MSAYLTAVLADNPTHYWRMADGGGALCHDVGSSRVQMHGVSFHQMLGYGGPVSDGGSADLALGGDYANTGVTIHFAGGQMSIEMWIWIWQALGSARYFAQWNNAPELSLQSNGANFGFVYNGLRAAGPAIYTAQAWHHVVGTFDGASIRCYVDGVSGAPIAGVSALAFDQLLELSSSLAVGTYGMSFYSEVALYATALSSSRVSAHFNAADQVSQPPVFGAAGGLGGFGSSVASADYLSILQQILQSVRRIY